MSAAATPAISALGARARALLDELAAVTDVPGEITRLYLSPAHKRSMDLVAGWMRARGLDVTVDALGTLRGRLAGAGGSNRRLLVGSHIDTVINAGRFDGCLGVVAGILVAEELQARGETLPFALDILAFGDEEGVRFPTSLSSSAALAGHFRPEWLDGADADGITLRQALTEFGLDPSRIPEAAIEAGDVLGYLELHIEQGPVLEQAGDALGVVTSIAGQSRFRIRIAGEAGHAGTVPMPLRHDAFMALAELAVFIEKTALAGSDSMVATIGRAEIRPGASNVIADRVEATLDIRAGADAPRLAAIAAIEAEAGDIAARRGVAITLAPVADVAACPMDADFKDDIRAGLAALGHRPVSLTSGAGHDAMAMALRVPAAMLFVRSKGGISHNPAEFTANDDLGLAIEALIQSIQALSRRIGG